MSKIYGIPTATPINPNKFTGGGTEPLIVTYGEDYIASHTIEEIKEAVERNRQVWLRANDKFIPLLKYNEGWATFVDHNDNRFVYFYDIVDSFVTITKANFPTDCASVEYVEGAVDALRSEIDGHGYITEERVTELIQDNIPATDGAYELIETITLDENTKTVERTKEPNETPYNFESVMVEYNLPQNSQLSSNVAGYIRAITKSGKKVEFYIDGMLKQTSKSYGRAYVYPKYGRLTGECTAPVTATYNVPSWLRKPVYEQDFIEQDPIVKVNTVLVGSGNDIPAGSVIKIWGVRVNA